MLFPELFSNSDMDNIFFLPEKKWRNKLTDGKVVFFEKVFNFSAVFRREDRGTCENPEQTAIVADDDTVTVIRTEFYNAVTVAQDGSGLDPRQREISCYNKVAHISFRKKSLSRKTRNRLGSNEKITSWG
jgi:hypothetical protein